MTYRGTGPASSRANGRPRLLARTTLLLACLGVALSAGTAAEAAVTLPAGHGDGGWSGNGSGNGRYNRNSFIINSPSHSNDVQHVRNVNVGGNTITPAAICKKPAGHCRIIQRVTVYGH